MTDLNKELERAVELAKLLNREVGNEEQLFLQANLLVEEGISELSKAVFDDDREQLRDALADAVVVAMGGVYMTGDKVDIHRSYSSVNDIFKSISTVLFFSSRRKILRNNWLFGDVISAVVSYSKSVKVNLASDLKAVNDSNLSKFCLTIAEGIDTQQQYLTQFNLESELKETGNPDYPYAVYSLEEKGNFKIGKLLKSINYKAPVFEVES